MNSNALYKKYGLKPNNLDYGAFIAVIYNYSLLA
jgi:hypothetical protein